MVKKISAKAREQQEKQLRDADSATVRRCAKELAGKRDELLQEIMDLQNEIAGLETRKGELQSKLNRCMTGVVLCEKMIGHFGKLTPGWTKSGQGGLKPCI